MRIPVGKIYRAFPELDRFTDEQCERFVRAACRQGWRRHVHRLIVGLAVFFSMVLATVAVYAVGNWLDRVLPLGLDRSGWFWPFAGTSLFVVLSPIFLSLLLRDRLLLRRLRLVIRARGTCPGCRYSLLGITVGDGNIVTCPECGMGLEADPGLDEITIDKEGRRSFVPSGQHKSLDFWTPRRRRIAKRLAIVAGVFVFVVLPLSWGGYEVFLRRQARTAAAERPGAAGILAHVEAHQPPGAGKDSGAINGWEAMQEVVAVIDQIELEVLEDPAFADDFGTVRPDYSLIDTGVREGLEPETRAYEQRMLDAALAVLAELREQDVLKEFDALADHRRVVHEFTLPAGQPVMFVGLPYLGDARQLARINAARMHLAWQAGDRDEFLAAFESGLAIARYCDQQPSLVEWLAGTAIEGLILDRARLCLLQRPDIEWIDGIEAAIERQRAVVPPDYWVRGYSLFMHDTIAWFFADAGRARFGRFSRELDLLGVRFDISEVWTKRLGTYAENRDTQTAFMQPYLDAVGTDAYARPAITPVDTSELLLLDYLTPAFGRVLQSNDRRTASRRATTIMLALERFRLDHGGYPVSLDELVPGYLAELPLDPWAGEPFRYSRLTKPGTAPRYSLYAFGRDMDDDGGRRWTGKTGDDSDMVFSPAKE